MIHLFFWGCVVVFQWWARNESSSDSTGNASSSGALSLLKMQCFNLSRFNKNIYPLLLLFCSCGSWLLWLLWSVQSCPHCVVKLNYIHWEQQCNEMTPPSNSSCLCSQRHLIWTVTGQTFGWLELKVFWGSGTMQILVLQLFSYQGIAFWLLRTHRGAWHNLSVCVSLSQPRPQRSGWILCLGQNCPGVCALGPGAPWLAAVCLCLCECITHFLKECAWHLHWGFQQNTSRH